jgi:hypothetical protein
MAAASSNPPSSVAEERQLLQRVLQAIESDDSALLQRIEKFCFSVADAFEKV